MNNDRPFRLEQCIVKPREFSIEFPDGETKILQPKFIEVLGYLATQYPRLVDRQELIDNIWDGNHYVGEKSLTNAIWNLRNELKRSNVNYIETVRKKGYRLQVKPIYLDAEVADVKTEYSPTWFTKKNNIISAFLVLLLAVVLFVFYNNQNFNEELINIESVTLEPGREVYPAISPNGQHLIYSWRRIGQQPNLYLRDLSTPTESAQQLTFSGSYEGRAVWHPNNKEIFFQRKSWNYTECEIIKLNITTLEQEKIGLCQGEIDFALDISPDGRYLAYTQSDNHFNKPHLFLIDLVNSNDISPLYECKADCDYKDLDFAFSPNGKKLAIARTLDEGLFENIFLFDLASKQFSQLTNIEGDIKGLAWHPDGKQIVYSAQISGERNGYILDIAKKNSQKLSIHGLSYPKFVPQTTEIIYHQWQNQTQLSSFSTDSSVASAPFPLIQSDYNYHSPHYSSVNNQLVFISNESGYDEIWVSDVDGSNRKKLTSMESHLNYPRWSHNGEFIAFLGPQSKNKRNAIFILNKNSHAIKKLETSFVQHYPPTWQIDDKAIIAGAKTTKRAALYSFPLNDEPPLLLLDQKVKFAQQTKDGKLWFSPGRNKGLWMLDQKDLTIGADKILAQDVFNVSYQWQVENNNIYFLQQHTKHMQFSIFSYDHRTLDTLVKLPTGTVSRMNSMTVLTEDKKLVFTQQEYPKVDVKRLSHPLLN